MRIRTLALNIVLAAGIATAVVAQEVQTPTFDLKPGIEAPLQKQVSELEEQSSWAQDTEYAGERPDKSQRGVYPVGNGLVFCYQGLGQRANTIQAITGPQYQTEERIANHGMFGEMTMSLWRDGKELPLRKQRLRRVRHANFVVSEDADADGATLRTLTFAQPDTTTLTRVIQIRGGKGTRLRIAVDGKGKMVFDDKLLLSYSRPQRKFFAVLGLSSEGLDKKVQVDESSLQVDVPDSGEWSGVVTISTGSGEAPTGAWSPTEASLASATDAARATMAWWSARLRPCPTFDTNHPKVLHLFEDWRILLLTQRCAGSGVIVPMINKRGAWIRQSSGAILALLRYNLHAEAKQVLDFFYNAARKTNKIQDYVPADLDLSGLPAAGQTAHDWSKLEIEDGELASWLVLQHFWYYRATRDALMVDGRKDFLLACLQGQKRIKDDMMLFGDNEPAFQQVIADYARHNPDKMPAETFLVNNAPDAGRRMYSMPRGALYLVAVQGYGEMLDGIDRFRNPKKYEVDETPMDRPGRPFLVRSFTLMENVEKAFFMDKVARFAPAVSPVSMEQQYEPIANLNLIPMWLGWTFTSGEKSRDNFRYTLHRLWRKGTHIGTTRSVDVFTGQIPGMILTGLTERNGKERAAHFDYMLQLAEPAGTWGELYDPTGRPVSSNDPMWPNRMCPNECGININAMLYSVTGIRHVSIPNFDDDSIKIKLKLPNKCVYFEANHLSKDGRTVSVLFREKYEAMTPAERTMNSGSRKENWRDPEKKHRRFWFRMSLTSKEPWKGFHQVDANCAGTMFVERISRKEPVEKLEFWKDDDEPYFPIDGKPEERPNLDRAVAKLQEMLVLSNRPSLRPLIDATKSTVIDTGMPFSMSELRGLLLADKKQPRHKKLLLDIEFDSSDPGRSAKAAAFWKSPELGTLIADFQQAGGTVIRATAIDNWRLASGQGEGRSQGAWFTVEAANGPVTLSSRFTADRARDVILRWGAGCGFSLKLNGNELSSQKGKRDAVIDAFEMLVTLQAGDNVLEVTLHPDGESKFVARLTDEKGLPAPGVQLQGAK